VDASVVVATRSVWAKGRSGPHDLHEHSRSGRPTADNTADEPRIRHPSLSLARRLVDDQPFCCHQFSSWLSTEDRALDSMRLALRPHSPPPSLSMFVSSPLPTPFCPASQPPSDGTKPSRSRTPALAASHTYLRPPTPNGLQQWNQLSDYACFNDKKWHTDGRKHSQQSMQKRHSTRENAHNGTSPRPLFPTCYGHVTTNRLTQNQIALVETPSRNDTCGCSPPPSRDARRRLPTREQRLPARSRPATRGWPASRHRQQRRARSHSCASQELRPAWDLRRRATRKRAWASNTKGDNEER